VHGQIYVEVERARLTKMLADIRERQGRIDEASDIMLDVQVETFGSMDQREKIEFILEQMRLSLARSDFIRTQIISKKISNKALEGSNLEVCLAMSHERRTTHHQNLSRILSCASSSTRLLLPITMASTWMHASLPNQSLSARPFKLASPCGCLCVSVLLLACDYLTCV
jgi:hypothetical protein